jgi:putative PIN family toxin of toxin-antitoxin system
MTRAVLDVNVIASAILGPLGLPRRILLAWEAGAFSAVTSAGIISEVGAKLSLPRISRRYQVHTTDDIRWVIGLLQTQAEIILVSPQECRVVTGDPEDDYVLATGRLARADYLVTGDRGLLGLGEYEGVKIIRPREFLAALGQEPAS